MSCGIQLHHNSTHRYEMALKKLPFILLPDKRTLFDVSAKSAIPPDCFFREDTVAPHCSVLKKMHEVLPKLGRNNECRTNLNEFALLFALHVDEMNIMAAHLFRNQSLFGPSHDNPNELANSMLVFLLATLTGKKIAINLCSKPVHNLKHECLHQILLSSLDKATQCGFETLPITMDSGPPGLHTGICRTMSARQQRQQLIGAKQVQINFAT